MRFGRTDLVGDTVVAKRAHAVQCADAVGPATGGAQFRVRRTESVGRTHSFGSADGVGRARSVWHTCCTRRGHKFGWVHICGKCGTYRGDLIHIIGLGLIRFQCSCVSKQRSSVDLCSVMYFGRAVGADSYKGGCSYIGLRSSAWRGFPAARVQIHGTVSGRWGEFFWGTCGSMGLSRVVGWAGRMPLEPMIRA